LKSFWSEEQKFKQYDVSDPIMTKKKKKKKKKEQNIEQEHEQGYN